jgi:hypothetical protein
MGEDGPNDRAESFKKGFRSKLDNGMRAHKTSNEARVALRPKTIGEMTAEVAEYEKLQERGANHGQAGSSSSARCYNPSIIRMLQLTKI